MGWMGAASCALAHSLTPPKKPDAPSCYESDGRYEAQCRQNRHLLLLSQIVACHVREQHRFRRIDASMVKKSRNA
jgi:hypothetical protein